MRKLSDLAEESYGKRMRGDFDSPLAIEKSEVWALADELAEMAGGARNAFHLASAMKSGNVSIYGRRIHVYDGKQFWL